jgi:hypothetical protein
MISGWLVWSRRRSRPNPGVPTALRDVSPRPEGIRRRLAHHPGKESTVTRRWVRNDRLNHAGYLWALSAITGPPGVGAH